MAHVRQQIVAAVVAALKDLDLTEDRVFSGRTKPLAKDHRPTILVYATDENVQQDAMASGSAHGAILMRTLTLLVECRVVVGVNDDPEEQLDIIATEVEPAMIADASLGGLTLSVDLRQCQIYADAPGEGHIGSLTLEYEIAYRTREAAPEAAI